MSYDADLINAYRNQLARIRQAWHVFKADDFTDCGVYEGFVTRSMEDVDAAISSTEADDIEALYRSNEPPILLPNDVDPIIRLPGNDAAGGKSK